eukprot:759717-Hanusia_phi.AAC.4
MSRMREEVKAGRGVGGEGGSDAVIELLDRRILMLQKTDISNQPAEAFDLSVWMIDQRYSKKNKLVLVNPVRFEHVSFFFQSLDVAEHWRQILRERKIGGEISHGTQEAGHNQGNQSINGMIIGRTTDSPRFNKYISLNIMILSANHIPVHEDLKPAEFQDHHFHTAREQNLGCPLWFESFEFTMHEDDSISIILWKWNSTYKDEMIGKYLHPTPVVLRQADFKTAQPAINGSFIANSNVNICDSFPGSKRNGDRLEDKYGDAAQVTLYCTVMNVNGVMPQSAPTGKHIEKAND